jgi:hypothetical protein
VTVDAGTACAASPPLPPPSQYAIDISCDPGANCWAPLLDILTQETSIARLNN